VLCMKAAQLGLATIALAVGAVTGPSGGPDWALPVASSAVIAGLSVALPWCSLCHGMRARQA